MKKSSIILSSLIAITCILPAFSEEEVKPEIKTEIKEKKREDLDYTRAFKEGTINLISPSTWKRDTFYINYSHNYFQASIPRGSNPAFHFSYTPIDRLQVDTILSLRNSPLEFEFGTKYQILDEFKGDPLSITPRIAYNTRGNVLGLDLSASKTFFTDILQVGLGYRVLNYFGNFKDDGLASNLVQGIGVNSILRVWKHWYLFGDAVIPFDGTLLSKSGFIWSAGIKKRIPFTPHILTLYAGNSNEGTISGRTISTGNGKYPDMLKLGFYFSIGIPEVSKLPEKLF
ncbi:MAG: hypothetical protein U0354_03395 [Candidatus Sericytochromatia bacterium]